MGVRVANFFGTMPLRQGAVSAAVTTGIAALVLIAVGANDLETTNAASDIIKVYRDNSRDPIKRAVFDAVLQVLNRRIASDALYIAGGCIAAVITVFLALGITKVRADYVKYWVYGCIGVLLVVAIGAILGLTIQLYSHIVTLVLIVYFVYLCMVVYSYHLELHEGVSSQANPPSAQAYTG